MNIYLFFSSTNYYPMQLQDDQAAKHRAEITGGIIRVETLAGKVIWRDNNRMK